VKLLDITEQPMGYAAAKKRKRQQDMEDAKRAAEEAATQVRFSQLQWVIYYNLPSSGFEILKHCCGSEMFIPDPDFLSIPLVVLTNLQNYKLFYF
jgi:hypothetical protein